jgi:hypothetical protein
VSFFLRCAFCIAVIYWLSPVSTSTKPASGQNVTASDKASLEAIITGSLRKKGASAVGAPAMAEQAARLLRTLDAKTRHKLVDSMIGAEPDEDRSNDARQEP